MSDNHDNHSNHRGTGKSRRSGLPKMLRPPRFVARVVAVSWRDLAVSMGPIVLISAAAIWLAIRLIQPAPPNTLTISAGPPGSSFWNAAQGYKSILARNGITLNVLPSAGPTIVAWGGLPTVTVMGGANVLLAPSDTVSRTV